MKKEVASAAVFSRLIQEFFTRRLIQQQNVSRCTVLAYRDTIRLFLPFLAERLHKESARLVLTDVEPAAVLAFLNHLERDRKNGARTRNARLATIRSFVRYAAQHDPTYLPVAQRILAIPMKRYSRPVLDYLSRDEMEAIIRAPDGSRWSGQRDQAFWAFLHNTGARVSEAIGCQRGDLDLDERQVLLRGKGRKERMIPLWRSTAQQLRRWLRRLPEPETTPLFPNARGGALSRSGVEDRLARAVEVASRTCPNLRKKSVSPHTIRHTTAMHLLQSGVEITVIALWLGHESPETTHRYMEADLSMKRSSLSKAKGVPLPEIRYRASDSLLDFLDQL